MKRPVLRFIVAFSGVLAVMFATLLPMCNLIFSCGCTFTGASHCNIHHAAGPMCPWCCHRSACLAGYAVTLLGIAASILTCQKSRAARGGLIVAFACGVAGYAVTLSLAGLATALYFHYPTWYGLHLKGGF